MFDRPVAYQGFSGRFDLRDQDGNSLAFDSLGGDGTDTLVVTLDPGAAADDVLTATLAEDAVRAVDGDAPNGAASFPVTNLTLPAAGPVAQSVTLGEDGNTLTCVFDQAVVIDPTADQFATPVPYAKGKGKGFLTL